MRQSGLQKSRKKKKKKKKKKRARERRQQQEGALRQLKKSEAALEGNGCPESSDSTSNSKERKKETRGVGRNVFLFPVEVVIIIVRGRPLLAASGTHSPRRDAALFVGTVIGCSRSPRAGR